MKMFIFPFENYVMYDHQILDFSEALHFLKHDELELDDIVISKNGMTTGRMNINEILCEKTPIGDFIMMYDVKKRLDTGPVYLSCRHITESCKDLIDFLQERYKEKAL